MQAYLGPDMRVINKRYFHLWHNHGGEIEYAHNNWQCTVWVPHLSEWIHSIYTKSKHDISWII
jgi:hypothetical protein